VSVGRVRFVAADVATADGVAALAEQALDLLGGIDILVSNAGGQTHRPGAAADVAQLIAFLVSPAAAYLTGSQFTVDGGALPTV
jgi:NAD(P)-dependent dehydrogenase (short-subunit alcohol dehydrogenase family)